MIASCVGFFLFLVFYLWPRFKELRTKRFKKRYFPAYEMLNLRHGKLTMIWPCLFMIRRTLFVVGVCFLVQYGALQIFLFLVPTIISMAVLASIKPLVDAPANRLEVFNSFTILLMIYCLMCFTPFAINPEARHLIGYVLVFLIASNIVLNIVIVSLNPVRQSCKRCKKRWAKRVQTKAKCILCFRKCLRLPPPI